MEDVITVERVGCALLVAAPGRDRDAADLAAALAPERRRTAVVVGASAAEAVARLDPWVVADLDEQVAGSLRLLAPHAGAVGPAGEVPPARLLAERLGVEVVAPDNALVRLSGGSVFVSGPGAGWVAYRPGATGRRSGPRHPAPWWQELLPGGPGEQIPLGLWLRAPGGDDRADDPLRTLSPDPERLVIVVGAPGEPAPESAAVADALRALPGEARDRTVLVCYGCDLAQALADELGGPVRALHGVPGPQGPVHLDERGGPTWRPFALESAHLPGAAPVVDRWLAPVASMRLIGPAAYRLADGWRLDVVPRGLLARPDDLPPEPAWSGRAGTTADLVVAARDEVPENVVAALDDLVRDLPADARRHLRVVPVSPFAEKAVTRLTELPDHCGPGVVVTADGRVLPAVPILAAPTPIALFTEEDLKAGEEPQGQAQAPAAGVAGSRSRVRPDRPVEPVEVVGNEPVVGLPEPQAAQVDQAPPTRSTRTAPAAEAPRPARPTALPTALAAVTAPPSPRTAPPPPTAAGTSAPAPAAPVRPVEPEQRSSTQPAVPGPATPGAEAEQPSDVPVPAGPEPVASGPVALEPVVPGPVAPVDLPPLTPPRGEPAQPVAPAQPVVPRAPISVPADARSTAEQRARVRAALGTRYDVAGRAVARLLAERPGLRGAHGNALAAELAVVRIFALDPAGDHDLDFHTCLVSGLRALPTARAVVLRGLPPGRGHVVGQVLSPRIPVSAVAASPDRRVPGVEALIWTTTARRLDGLLDADRRDEVLLPAHTRLRVLAVEEGGRRVLLAEEGAAEEQALTRLRAAAADRPAVPDAPTTDFPTHEAGGGSPWFGDLPTA